MAQRITTFSIVFTATSSLLMGCGQGGASSKDQPQGRETPDNTEPRAMAADNLLADFLKWTPVLQGDKAFSSLGHGGILVRSYLNKVAVEQVKNSPSTTYPLPEGSLLAKAVVATPETPAASASRVYFMRKEAPGFDSANGDWSYSLAKRQGSKLVFDTSIKPTEPLCVSCHVKFKKFDNVKTVEFYKKQATEEMLGL